jgi:hypothetical protein
VTFGRRLVGSLCIVVAAAACSGSNDSAPTPTTYKRTIMLALRPLLGTSLQKGTCPAGTVPGVVQGTCYRVGPAFITQADIATADAAHDPMTDEWVVNTEVAPTARRRFLHAMTRLVNQQVAIEIDNRVVNVATVNPGITGSAFQISSHQNWTITQAIETAAGIAKPSRPPCTARTCPTSTTGEDDRVAARCDRVAPSLGYTAGVTSATDIEVATLRSAFRRAHEPIPGALANVDATELVAICSYSQIPPPGQTTPTTTCPNGVAMAVTVDFAVDAGLHVIRHLPAQRYLYADGLLSGSDPCDNQPNGP